MFRRFALPLGTGIGLIVTLVSFSKGLVSFSKDLREISCSTFRFCPVLINDLNVVATQPQPGIVASPPLPASSLQTSRLTVGVLGKHESYQPLVDYLRRRFGEGVNIELDGDGDLPYQEARDQINAKHWDIVFTLSPMLSVTAEKRGYQFVGPMFPGSRGYQSVIFVAKDSPIQSLSNLGPRTRLAMGGFNSASSFYMPAYDLAGKELTVDMGHRGPEIKEMVRNGKADAGAGAYGDLIKPENQDLRIIHQSRDIPGSAVYLSPRLSEADAAALKQALLEAPEDVRDSKHANYGPGEPADYTEFIKITSKVEDLLRCSNFNQQPVRFFCPAGSRGQVVSSVDRLTITGQVNGWTKPTASIVVLTVIDQMGNTYHVRISPDLLEASPGFANMTGLQRRTVQLSGVTPKQSAKKLYDVAITSEGKFQVLE